MLPLTLCTRHLPHTLCRPAAMCGLRLAGGQLLVLLYLLSAQPELDT
jgi:hypothetical protein